jgi:hypothetical protein
VETWRSSCRGDLWGHEIEVDLAEVDGVLNGDFCDGTNTNPPPPSRGRTCGLRLQNAPGNRLVHKSPGSTMGESVDMIRALSIHLTFLQYAWWQTCITMEEEYTTNRYMIQQWGESCLSDIRLLPGFVHHAMRPCEVRACVPSEWTDDRRRRGEADVPKRVAFTNPS